MYQNINITHRNDSSKDCGPLTRSSVLLVRPYRNHSQCDIYLRPGSHVLSYTYSARVNREYTVVYGTPEGTFPFQYSAEKKLDSMLFKRDLYVEKTT